MKKSKLIIFIRRVLTSILVLFLLISFVFVIIRLSPGDPAQKYLSPKLSPKLHEEIANSYHLDSPIAEQYITFVKNIFVGDLGISYTYRKPVVSVIGQYLPFTIFFSITAFILQIIFSSLLVYFAVRYKGGIIDKLLTTSSMVIYAVPVFLSSIFLIYIFSYQMNAFSSSGIRSFNFDELSVMGKLLDYIKHLLLPLIAISLTGIPIFYKYLRDSIISNLNSLYVMNLSSLGISRKEIILKYVLPNSVNSVIAVAGIELGILLGGTVIVETIFSLPGMGQLTMNAVLARDYPLVVGCTITAGILILLANMVADVIRVSIDKRLLKELMT